MDRLNNIIEVVKQSHHMPALLSLLVGLFIIKKSSFLHVEDGDALGDNIPTFLMDGLKK